MTDTLANIDWPEEVNTDTLEIDWEDTDNAGTFYELVEFINRFSVFPDKHGAIIMALWILHTHAMDQFCTTPRMIVASIEPGCGKTRAMEIAECFVHDPWFTGPVSGPTVNARLQRSTPTLLLDETDTMFRANGNGNEALREVLNTGYKRNATKSNVAHPEGWSLYSPIMMAGLSGRMHGTVKDRSITLMLAKAKSNSSIEEFEYDVTQKEAEPLKSRLANMMKVLIISIDVKQNIPAMPPGVIGRPREVWRPLLAVAEAIGGDVVDKARAACLANVIVDDMSMPAGSHRLLTTLREIFGERKGMLTSDILEALAERDSETWNPETYTQWKLSADLHDYGVLGRNVRVNGEQAKGYVVAGDSGLGQAWDEHL